MLIGITGGLGTGKTTAAKMFSRLGAKVIDADRVVHSLIDINTRKKLAKIVFRHKVYLDILCKIIHPLVIRQIGKQINRLNPKKSVIIIDAPLLMETGLHKHVDVLVVVKTKKETQIKRSMKRLGLKRSEILRRMGFQIPLIKKIRLADFVIDNDGSFAETRRQVVDIWKRIKQEGGKWKRQRR